jgi:hypothetical protein
LPSTRLRFLGQCHEATHEALPTEIPHTTQALAGRRFHVVLTWWFLLFFLKKIFKIAGGPGQYGFATAEKSRKTAFCYGKLDISKSKNYYN